MRNGALLFIALTVILSSCHRNFGPKKSWRPDSGVATPTAPDYAKSQNWASLPEKADPADRIPKGLSGINNQGADAAVDVFFVHPTSYLEPTELSKGWNADVTDKAINSRTDNGSIAYQASSFNGVGRIYAPRYRQANICIYWESDSTLKSSAFDTAYADVKNAFIYFLKNYNHGRPFIIASHSQGTTHAIRLMQEFLDNDDALAEKLVAAYLIGMDVYDTLYKNLRPCTDSDDTRCYVSWRTYARNHFPQGYVRPAREAVCTNPLTWKTDSVYASRTLNRGGILKKFDRVIPELCDAQVLDGVVRISKPHFTGSVFYNIQNYHIVDYNLFYTNIRENAILRSRMFIDIKPDR